MTSPILTPVLSLLEYAKGPSVPDEARPLIEMFAESSDIIGALPFLSITGFVYQGYRQAALQGTMAFRAINAPSTSGAGSVQPFQETTFVIDHDIPIDRVLVEHASESRRRAWEEKSAMSRLGELVVTAFLKGDNTVTPTSPSGLQKRSALYGRTYDNANGVAGGAALSLYNLDNAIQNCNNPTHIIVPWAMKSRFLQAQRNVNVGGYIMKESIGKTGVEDGGSARDNRQLLSYAELPLLFGYEKDLHAPVLPFTEVAPGGGAAVCASIYVCSFAEQGLCGLQSKPMTVRDFGLLQDGITYNTHVSWDIGFADNHLFCFTRLAGITNQPIVA